MTTYKVIPKSDGSGFDISIAGSDGARQTMLGFASEAEAQVWIDRDRRLGLMQVQHSVSDVPVLISG